MATTVCATLSAIVGTPSIRTPPAVRLGDLHRPDRRRQVGPRAHPIPDLVEVVPQIGLELLQILPVHSRRALVGLDLPPRLPDHRLGNRKRLLFGLGMLLRLLPEPTAPVERIDIPDQPAPSLHPHPSEQGSLSYYGPVRQRAPQPVLNASGFCRWHAPSRDLGGLRPRTTLSTLAFSRSVPEPQTRLTPPSRRAPPGQSSGTRQAHHGRTARPPAFDATSIVLTTPQQRTPTPRTPGPDASGTSSWSPPDASSAPSPRSLTTTVFSQRSTGRFSALPRRTTLEGQQASISGTAPPMNDVSYMTSSFSVRDTRLSRKGFCPTGLRDSGCRRTSSKATVDSTGRSRSTLPVIVRAALSQRS